MAADLRQPYRSLSEIQGEVNRMLDSAFGRAVTPAEQRTWAPRCDLWETKDALVLAVELPGVNEKDVTVSITGDLLTLRGERRWPESASESTYHHVERVYGKFERVIQVATPVQSDKVTASYRDGVLTVTLPKMEAVKPRGIKIDVL